MRARGGRTHLYNKSTLVTLTHLCKSSTHITRALLIRLHLPILLHWELNFQHINLEKHIQTTASQFWYPMLCCSHNAKCINYILIIPSLSCFQHQLKRLKYRASFKLHMDETQRMNHLWADFSSYKLVG